MLDKELSCGSEALLPLYFLCNTTKLSPENQGVPILPYHVPRLGCMEFYTHKTYCHVQLLLHQIYPKSSYVSCILRLGDKMSILQCQRHHLKLLCDSSIFISSCSFALKSLRFLRNKEQIWPLKGISAGKFITNPLYMNSHRAGFSSFSAGHRAHRNEKHKCFPRQLYKQLKTVK